MLLNDVFTFYYELIVIYFNSCFLVFTESKSINKYPLLFGQLVSTVDHNLRCK